MKKWEKHEQDTAASFGTKPITGSGRIPSMKGDVKTANFLIENKQTDKESYILKKEIWEKITKEAEIDRKIPLMSLNIDGTILFVMSADAFLSLVDSASNSSEGDFEENIVPSCGNKKLHFSVSKAVDGKYKTFCGEILDREYTTTEETQVTCSICQLKLRKLVKT